MQINGESFPVSPALPRISNVVNPKQRRVLPPTKKILKFCHDYNGFVGLSVKVTTPATVDNRLSLVLNFFKTYIPRLLAVLVEWKDNGLL